MSAAEAPEQACRAALRLLVLSGAWPPEPRLARLLAGAARAGLAVAPLYGRRLGGWRWIPRGTHRPLDLLYVCALSTALAQPDVLALGLPVIVRCSERELETVPYDGAEGAVAGRLHRLLERAAALHCPSRWACGAAIRDGARAARTVAIHEAPVAAAPPLREPERRPARFSVAALGRLDRFAGLEYALVAVRRLVDSGVPVRLVVLDTGDRAQQQQLRYTVADLGLAPHICLDGPSAQADRSRLLHRADAFLETSVTDAISGPLLDAMACGLPVVTSDCGGVRELVTDGREGFVVPSRAPEATARALRSLWADPGLRERMGQAGATRVRESFTPARETAEFVEMCRAACGLAAGDRDGS